MNKYQLYKQIRQELATGCDKELKAVSELLDSGITSITGGDATLEVALADSVNSMSEAGRVFRDELNESMRLILDRYRRNLQKEIASLGLDDVRIDTPQQQPRSRVSNGSTQLRPDAPVSGTSHHHEPA